MGGSAPSTTTVANNDPWEGVQPYLQDVFAKSQNLYDSGAGSQLWSGPTLAGQSNATKQALDMTSNIAGGTDATAGYDSALRNIKSDPGSNPYLTQMLDANANRIGSQVASQMSGMGRYGSFGHADALARTINETNLPILSNAYESDQNRKLQWGAMLPQLNELQYDPASRLAAVGAIGDQRAQQELDATRALFEQQQQMPWQQIGRYSAGLSGLSGLVPNTGNSTTTSNGGDAGAMPLVGGALSLLAL